MENDAMQKKRKKEIFSPPPQRKWASWFVRRDLLVLERWERKREREIFFEEEEEVDPFLKL
jgi:hypothetical protein